VRFWHNDDKRILPRVIAEGDRCVVDRDESIWSGLESPFEECVIDPRGARSGLVGGQRNGSLGLLLGDRWEVMWRKGGGVVGLYGCDLRTVSNEELLLQGGTHVYWVMGEGGVRGEEWGDAFN